MNKEYLNKLDRIICSDYANIAGMVVQKNGVTLYEQGFNGFTPSDPIHVASVTKSVFSALIGIARDKGLLTDINRKVLDFFPEYKVMAGETTIQNITLKDLLTMTAPYKYETEPYEAFFASPNWVEKALDLLGGKGKIGNFVYSAMVGTQILSGVLARVTGKPVLDFAVDNLFSPLGIKIEQNVVFHNKEDQLAWFAENKKSSGWVVDPQGINTAGWGLTMTPLDMSKIGQLYLKGGLWDGKQILSTEWIEESTSVHSRWGKLLYGYLWWIIDDKDRIFAALGDGGNVIYVNTKNNFVVSIASLFMPVAKDRIELIRKVIEPTFDI